MHARVRKWGNSPAIRLPAAVMVGAGLRVDAAVDVRVEDGRVIIERIAAAADDPAFAAALAPTLGEWASAEDDAAWADL